MASVACAALALLYGCFALALLRYRHDVIRDEAALRTDRDLRARKRRQDEGDGVGIAALGDDDGRVVEQKGLFYAGA